MRSLRDAILAGSAAQTLAVGVGVGVAMADPSSTLSDAAFVAVGDTVKTRNDANCSFPRPNGANAGVLQLQ